MLEKQKNILFIWMRPMLGRAYGESRRLFFGFLRYCWKQVLPPAMRHWIKRKREARAERIHAALFHKYAVSGAEVVLSDVENSNQYQGNRARALVALSKHALKVNVVDASAFARGVINYDKRGWVQRRVALSLWDSGEINFPGELLEKFPEESVESESVLEKVRQIQGCWRVFNSPPRVPPKLTEAEYKPRDSTLLYVASSSRPYHTTGYTSRTHYLLRAIKKKEWHVHCITRPGYPFDRPDTKEISESLTNEIDGIPYERIPSSHRRQVRYDKYLVEAAERIEQVALRVKPTIIQAASNYETGLPALIAARRLGIPFVYEVRGLWEYTAASKKPGWEKTERFLFDQRLEKLVADNADHVFTLNNSLRDELVARGASFNKISLLPNAIEPEKFARRSRNEVLAGELGIKCDQFVIGYIGSLVAYEGLDSLIKAIELLKDEFPKIRLLIVGDGDARVVLKNQVNAFGLEDLVMFTGKVAPDAVHDYFSLFDVTVLPRKSFDVCNLVSPLKPLEAMAMEVPLVVSSVPALAEMVEEGRTALIHRPGDSSSIAECLKTLIKSRELRQYLAKNALESVVLERSWSCVVEDVVQTLKRISTYS